MSQKIIGILDYGVGNITSLKRALERIGCSVIVSYSESELLTAHVLFLPGVGSFSYVMANLKNNKMDKFISNRFRQGDLTIVGICLGLQIMFEHSEEGNCEGLGLLKGNVVKFTEDECHVGWNEVLSKRKDLIVNKSAFYFNHSYKVQCADKLILAESFYQGELVSIVESNQFTGVQFHPEKSQKVGENLLKRLVGAN